MKAKDSLPSTALISGGPPTNSLNANDLLLAGKAIPQNKATHALLDGAPALLLNKQESPLEMTWQEQASMVQRLGINKAKGEHLGPPMGDGEGNYTFPVYDKAGAVIGGTTVHREGDVLKGSYGKEGGGIDANAEFVPPTISSAYKGGKAVQSREDGDGFEAAPKLDSPSFETGGKAYVKGAVVEVQSGEFGINPDGSGRGYSITVGGLKGEMAAKGVLNLGIEGKKPGANFGMGGEANAQLASGSLKAEAYGAVKPTSDPESCTQWTVSGEGGAQLGLGASAMATMGTDGVKGKIAASIGPGLSAGGSVGRPSVECKVIGTDASANPLSSNPAEGSALKNEFLQGVKTSSSPDDFVAASSRQTSMDDAPTNEDSIPTLDKLTPKYGNYCGPSWIGGMYDNGNVCRVEWKPPVDDMDAACRDHDYAYIRGDVEARTPNTNPDKQEADLDLLDKINNISNSDLGSYGDAYKVGVREVFGYKTGTQGTVVGLDNAWESFKDTVSDGWGNVKDVVGGFFGSPSGEKGAGSPGAGMDSSGSAKSIAAAEDESESEAGNADGHADRAEAAARRAKSAARRAAAAQARLQAMISRGGYN